MTHRLNCIALGPVVVFDGIANSGANHAIVISPATHFKGATMLRWGDDWAIGMSGEITEVPVGFAHETIIVAGTGVTETMDRYVLTTLPSPALLSIPGTKHTASALSSRQQASSDNAR